VDAANDSVVEMSLNDAGVDLETIFHAQYERIARVIAGITKDPARAEELAVEVFLKWERTPNAQPFQHLSPSPKFRQLPFILSGPAEPPGLDVGVCPRLSMERAAVALPVPQECQSIC
jgi:hypothetical protein